MTTVRTLCLAALVCLCGLCDAADRGPERRVQFSPARIELSGMLVERKKPGPPGWGESPGKDKILTAPVLLLDHAVTVVGDATSDVNSETVPDVKELQLADLSHFRRNVGRRITISGVLNTATTGWSFTKVIASGVKVVSNAKD